MIMAFCPINHFTAIDVETMETVRDFLFFSSKITTNGDLKLKNALPRVFALLVCSVDQSCVDGTVSSHGDPSHRVPFALQEFSLGDPPGGGGNLLIPRARSFAEVDG